MPDPLETLRLPATPEAPRPEFAAALRGRVQAALGLWPDPTPAAAPAVEVRVIPYLCVADGEAALRFYGEAFGAAEVMRVQDDTGKIGHAEFHIGGTAFYLAEEFPEMGVVSPTTLGGTPVSLHLTVPDVDRVHAGAVQAGAVSLMEPGDQTHGARHSTIQDPFGHRWMLSTPIEQLTVEQYAARETEWQVTGAPAEQGPVELGYLHMPTRNLEQARTFFSALFGWQFESGARGPGYGHIANTRQLMGMNEHDDEIQLSFRVDDLGNYLQRLEDLGGKVLSRKTIPVGELAACEDNQGFRFALLQPTASL
jgi:uncharacterized glyoxalase superfamily protein PhnB